MATVNVRGLNIWKKEVLQTILKKQSIDLLIITETWARSDMAEILGSHRMEGAKAAGQGGVAIATHGKYRYKKEQANERMIRLTIQNPPCTIIGVYAPHTRTPIEQRRHFWADLNTAITNSEAGLPLIIIGDFNAAHEKTQHNYSRNLVNWYELDAVCKTQGLTIAKSEPTWRSATASDTTSARTLDRIIYKGATEVHTNVDWDQAISDHAFLCWAYSPT